MNQSIVHIAVVVRDYDEALDFYLNKLDFVLVEDTYLPEQDKRWVVVSPPGSYIRMDVPWWSETELAPASMTHRGLR